MDMETRRVRELQRQLEDLSRGAVSMTDEHAVSFEKLFPPDFMKRHTSLDTIQELMDLSGFGIQDQDDFLQSPDKDWDAYIRKVTQFPDWKSMMDEAVQSYTVRQLGL